MNTDANITKDIEDAIKKSLPAAVGDVLNKELLELKRLRLVENSYEDLKVVNKNLSDRILKLEFNAKTAAELDKQEAMIAEQARNLKVTIAEVNASNAINRVNDMKELVATVFRGPMVTKHLSGNVPVPVGSTGNAMGFVGTYPINTTETTQG